METFLLCVAFVLLQGATLVASIACFVKQRPLSYYAILYLPLIIFGAVAGLVKADGWLAAFIAQGALSIT